MVSANRIVWYISSRTLTSILRMPQPRVAEVWSLVYPILCSPMLRDRTQPGPLERALHQAGPMADDAATLVVGIYISPGGGNDR